MGKWLEFLKSNPNLVLVFPTILCFAQFVYEVIEIIETGKLDVDDLNNLASSANGFETVILFFTMIVLKNKKK